MAVIKENSINKCNSLSARASNSRQYIYRLVIFRFISVQMATVCLRSWIEKMTTTPSFLGQKTK
jgi:hypothetical protein